MVVIDCFVMMGDGRHRAETVVVVVPVIGPGVCVADVWVEAYPYEVHGGVPSSDNIELSGIVSPLPNVEVHFPSFPMSRVILRLCNSDYTLGWCQML